MWRRLRHRVGHRGSALLFFGVLDVVYGLVLLLENPTPGTALAYLDGRIPPLDGWAVVWIGVGLVCLTQAFRQRDRIAFTCAMMIKFLWGCAHLGAVAAGVDRAAASAAIWLMAIGLVATIAHWPEPRYIPDTEGGP